MIDGSKKISKCKLVLLLVFILNNVFGVDDNMRNVPRCTKNLKRLGKYENDRISCNCLKTSFKIYQTLR